MSSGDRKVIGELSAASGVGVLGRNTATSGDAIGVKGETASGEGYGLYTDDDARVAGTIEAGTIDATVARIDGSELYVQATEPTDASAGDVWIDTS